MLLSNIVPSLRVFSVCRIALSKCNSRGGDCMGANSCAHSLSHSPWSTLPSSRAIHADHLLGHDLFMGRFCPSGFPTVVCTAASLHLMHRSFVSRVSPFKYWGCGLRTTFLYLLLLYGMSRPEVSTPLPCPLLPCRLLLCLLLLCRLLHSCSCSRVSGGDTSLACQNVANAFIMLSLSDARGRSTP